MAKKRQLVDKNFSESRHCPHEAFSEVGQINPPDLYKPAE